jgi:hypothetical protein
MDISLVRETSPRTEETASTAFTKLPVFQFVLIRALIPIGDIVQVHSFLWITCSYRRGGLRQLGC